MAKEVGIEFAFFEFLRSFYVDNRGTVSYTHLGPLLIIAGPGTGKTYTLVKRIVYLIIEKDVLPEEIMIATFTEKAAKELITRITNELYAIGVSVNLNEMYIGTFHSICLRILNPCIFKMIFKNSQTN